MVRRSQYSGRLVAPGVHYINDNDNENNLIDTKLPLPSGLAPKILYDDLRKLSVDPKVEEELEKLDYIRRIMENSDILIKTQAVVERGFIARNYNITTVPTRIIQARYMRGYILINPAEESAGGGSAPFVSSTLLASATRLAAASGNTQATPVSVANYRTGVLFLNISANVLAPTIQIDVQTRDPLSLNWATAQSDIFGSPSAVGTYYANIGTLGVDQNFAIAFTVTGGTSSTFSLSFAKKEKLSGTSTGTSSTIWIGPDSVNRASGFPILDGQKEKFFFRNNTELWAVSESVSPLASLLRVFELQ
jgi:hypothetical protein